MSSEIELHQTDFGEVLRQAVASGQIESLVKAIDKEAETRHVERPLTKQQKRDLWKQDKESMDLDKVQRISDLMSEYVEKHFVDRVDMQEPRELTQEEIDKLAEEYLDLEEITTLISSRNQMFRKMVFSSLDERHERERKQFKLDDEIPSSQKKGRLVSKEYGVAFCREGGARSEPSIDWQKLKESLDEETFKKVCTATVVPEQIIPEHVEYVPDSTKLMDALNRGEIDLEVMRETVVPGKWQTPKFRTRRV